MAKLLNITFFTKIERGTYCIHDRNGRHLFHWCKINGKKYVAGSLKGLLNKIENNVDNWLKLECGP